MPDVESDDWESGGAVGVGVGDLEVLEVDVGGPGGVGAVGEEEALGGALDVDRGSFAGVLGDGDGGGSGAPQAAEDVPSRRNRVRPTAQPDGVPGLYRCRVRQRNSKTPGPTDTPIPGWRSTGGRMEVRTRGDGGNEREDGQASCCVTGPGGRHFAASSNPYRTCPPAAGLEPWSGQGSLTFLARRGLNVVDPTCLRASNLSALERTLHVAVASSYVVNLAASRSGGRDLDSNVPTKTLAAAAEGRTCSSSSAGRSRS